MEICFRTHNPWDSFSANNDEWSNTVSKITGIPLPSWITRDRSNKETQEEIQKRWKALAASMDRIQEKYQFLDLEYIYNDRITSTYIYGPNRMRTLVIGDIHGAYKALIQALQRANYDPTNDRLITLGDLVDGWSQSYEVIDFLSRTGNENDVHMIGNHDEWFQWWIETARAEPVWVNQGGMATLSSYVNHGGHPVPEHHEKFMKKQRAFYLDRENDFVFVHAGWDSRKNRIDVVKVNNIMWWTRSFWATALLYSDHDSSSHNPHNRVFIGHTSLPDGPPMKHGGVWNLDTGAGWDGRLTIMDAETEEYWQSDNAKNSLSQ